MNLLPEQTELVQKLIKNENTFFSDTIFSSDNGIIYGSRGSGKKICVLELIKQKPSVHISNYFKRLYSIFSSVCESTLPEDIFQLICDFTLGNDKYFFNLHLNSFSAEFINTTLIVSNKIDKHIWYNLYKKYYKKHYKAHIINYNYQVNHLIRNNFQSVHNKDLLLISQEHFNYLNKKTNDLSGYCFNRVVFSNMNIFRYPIPLCPSANFVWCFIRCSKYYKHFFYSLPTSKSPKSRLIWSYMQQGNSNIFYNLSLELTLSKKLRLWFEQHRVHKNILKPLNSILRKSDSCSIYLCLSLSIKKEWVTNNYFSNASYVLDKNKPFNKDKFLKKNKKIF